VSKPALPGDSSQKSKGGSAAVVAEALSAADAAFTTASPLPLERDPSSNAGPIQGRKRLGGAYLIETSRIRPDPAQPRKRLEQDAQAELVASVRRHGILQPVTVRYVSGEDIYQIIAGERRYLAARGSGLTEIPCSIQTPREEEVLLHQIVENWQRLDMHPYDLADALARLRDSAGMSQKQIAQATGKSEGEISKLLALLDLSPVVQELARDDGTGHITKRHLYAVRSLSPDRQEAVIRKTQAQGLTAQETEQIASKEEGRPHDRPARRGAPVSYHRFRTTNATVSLTFRRKEVTTEEILGALDEARAIVEQRSSQ